MFKSFLWAFVEKSGQFFLQFISLIVLSRLLSPQDYGIYGTMMIFIAIAELLIDSGFGGAIVQKKYVSSLDIGTLFITNFAISIVLYIIIYILSPYISSIYDLPELCVYLRTLGVVVILYSLTIVHVTLLQKELKLRESAQIQLCSTLGSVMCAIFFAYSGFGVWALIIQQLSNAFIMNFLFLLKDRRNISICFSYESFRSLWGFGSKILLANIIRSLYDNISASIIPKIASMRVSGLYVQASRIFSVPVNIIVSTIDKATFPILSQEQTESQLLLKAREINKIILSFGLPLFPLLSLFSDELVFIALGNEWIASADYLSVLALGGIGTLIQSLYRNIFKSLGYTSYILFVDIVRTLIAFVLLISSIRLGVLFMIYSLTFSMYIGPLLYSFFLRRAVHYSYKEQWSDLFKPLLSTFAIYVASSLILRCISFHWYNVFISILIYIIYLLFNCIIKNRSVISCISRGITYLKDITCKKQ